MTLAALRRFLRFDLLRRRAEDAAVQRSIAQLRIKTPTPTRGRHALGRQPAEGRPGQVPADRTRVLLLDEPTRGIDVGAKAEIYALISELAQAGPAS